MEGYFHKFIMAENESNREHEEFRTEMTNLLYELEEQREGNEKSIRLAADAEISIVKAVSEQKLREDEEPHHKIMVAEIERIENEMKKAIQEERENYQKEMEKLGAEEVERWNKLKKDQEDRDKDEDEESWSDFLLQAVPSVLNFIPDFTERN